MARRPRPELLALLRVCKDNLEEDAPRLVLADWLAEHGDEHDAARAELIRLLLSSTCAHFHRVMPPGSSRRVVIVGTGG